MRWAIVARVRVPQSAPAPEALGELPEHVPAVARRHVAGDANAAVEEQRRVRGRGRDAEAHGAARGRDQDARDRGADHPAGLPRDRAERDRVRQALAIDEARDQRQPARLVERAEGAAQRGQREQVLDARQRERGQDEGDGEGQRGEHLRDDQQP
jgi:hypothetical protein